MTDDAGTTDASQKDQSPKPQAKVVTVSDGVVAGTREDLSGVTLVEHLESAGFEVLEHRVIADGVERASNTLSYMALNFVGIIATTGGTGFGHRDETPEGTRRILDKTAPGLTNAMAGASPLNRLSRGVAGVRGRADPEPAGFDQGRHRNDRCGDRRAPARGFPAGGRTRPSPHLVIRRR